jgi:periplasmic divalent cation tolerance protein
MGSEFKDILVVMVTTPNQEEAARIAELVVQSRHAACATTVPSVESTYWWEGKLVTERETLLLFKTTIDKFPSLQEAIRQIHPYKVPEIVAMPVKDGLPQYLEWVMRETH